MTNELVRYYSGVVDTQGAVVEVFGWYEKQEWVKVRLVKRTANGWLVKRVHP